MWGRGVKGVGVWDKGVGEGVKRVGRGAKGVEEGFRFWVRGVRMWGRTIFRHLALISSYPAVESFKCRTMFVTSVFEGGSESGREQFVGDLI